LGFSPLAAYPLTHFRTARVPSLLRFLEAGQRGVLLSTQVPETVFCLKEAPHAWLFPRVTAVVHHGGAGSPTLVTPFALDQYAWGRIVAGLGVGPKAIPVRKRTAGRLAAAVQTAVFDGNGF
jgi:UDP:flavonoid glycosyltransferase YjiC (YdhE family)